MCTAILGRDWQDCLPKVVDNLNTKPLLLRMNSLENVKKGVARRLKTRVPVVEYMDGVYECPVAECRRPFSSARGAISHYSLIHKRAEDANRALTTSIPCVLNDTERIDPTAGINTSICFLKWTTEELSFLCRCEYEVRDVPRGRPRLVYNMMANLGFKRTLQAVETQLRTKKYRDMRDQLFTQWSNVNAVQYTGPSPGFSVTARLIDPNLMGQSEAVTPEGESNRTQRSTNIVHIIEYLEHLGTKNPKVEYNEPLLDEIIKCLSNDIPVQDELEAFLQRWPCERDSRCRKPKGPKGAPVSKRHVRRLVYKRFREKWKKCRSRVASEVLEGRTEGEIKPCDIDGFQEHWSETFKMSDSTSCDVTGMKVLNSEYEIWSAIKGDELSQALRDIDVQTSSGPDGIPAKELKQVPARVLLKLLNIFMAMGRVPDCLKRSRTVFIPKKPDSRRPNEFRPISITSVILRLFNKLLARRVVAKANFDYRQKAFLPIDGCAENVILLESIIAEARKRCASVYIANLDMTNAYGSVHHEAIYEALRCNGAPCELITYVKELYSGFTTVLEISDDNANCEINVGRGVLQGDPLSPVLFNMVMDQMLKKIPDEIGFPLYKEVRINGMAFADDKTLVAQTPRGLQIALDITSTEGRKWGLEFNSKKCSYLAIISKRGRKVVVSNKCKFVVNGGAIRGLDTCEPWRYLGAFFTGRGLCTAPVMLNEWLLRLKKAMLKPQEKLYVVRVHLLPKLIHVLSMGVLTAKRLCKMDRTIRNALTGKHGMLHLPVSTPKAFFYAPVGEGGLGLMRLRHSIPAIVINRFGRLQESHSKIVRNVTQLSANKRRLRKANKLLVKCNDIYGSTPDLVTKINAMLLHEHVDAEGLSHAKEVPYVHEWVSKGSTAEMSGRDFIDAIKLRINALPTRSRLLRGTGRSNKCRAGCGRPESMNHILQACPRPKGARVRRHDDVVKCVSASLIKIGYEVQMEPIFKTSVGLRKPDIVAVKDGKVYVIDPTICGDNYHPDIRHAQKVDKYESIPEIRSTLAIRYPGSTIEFGSVALTQRGIWSVRSEEFLRDLGVCKEVIKRITRLTILGSIKIFRAFRNSSVMTGGGGHRQ